jgi:2-iminobutanoate/2-iminopropanoate deaminase
MTSPSWRPRAIRVPGLMDPDPFAYSQCVVAGPLVFVAGQMGVDELGSVVAPDFAGQLTQTFRNIERALHAVGSDLDHVVSMTTFLTDMRYAADLVRIRAEVFGGAPPAGALVGVDQLAWPELSVEIQAVAVLPDHP